MNRLLALCFALIATTSLIDDAVAQAKIELKLSAEQKVAFCRVSPQSYKIDYPDFYVLETEVTNAQYKAYLDATGQTKDDTEVLRIIEHRTSQRDARRGDRRVIVFSTGDIPYAIADASTIWRDGNFPSGLGEHPVALITLPDAIAFAQWLAKSHANVGRIRLPTWNEWMIAAYGKTRNYPWGNDWDSNLTHTSHGKLQKRTEPVRSRPKGRSPEGVFGLIGNVAEYIHGGDLTNDSYHNLGSRSMGGGFNDGRASRIGRLWPRTDYWGYSHHTTQREDHLGFRLVIDLSDKADALLKRPPVFEQKNRAWMIDSDVELLRQLKAKP